MKKRLPYAGGIVLTICAAYVAFAAQANSAPVTPTINPEPAHLFHISGTIDPSLEIESIRLTLVTNNGACYITKNWLEVGPEPQTYQYDFPATTKGGRFSATVALDQFQQVECKWLPREVDMIVKKGTTKSVLNWHWWGIEQPEIKGIHSTSYVKQRATSTPKEFDVLCRYFEQRRPDRGPSLGCTHEKGYQYMITMDAKEVVVNIHEGDLSYNPKYDFPHRQ